MSTETRPGRPGGAATAALRAALDEHARHLAPPPAPTAPPTRPQLEAISWRLARLADEVRRTDAGTTLEHLDLTALGEDLVAAARLARDAALHGYPRPALEHLGHAADRIPTARTSDPSTSRAELPVPNRRNQLGRLLVGWLKVEDGTPYGAPRGATSEEVARRVGMLGSEYAKRASDLLALGLLEVARDDDGHERTRAGRSGRQRLVFRLTPNGQARALDLAAGLGDD